MIAISQQLPTSEQPCDAAAEQFLADLKQDTAAAHRAIEAEGLLAQMFTEAFDLDQYQQLLAAHYGYYRALEPLLTPLRQTLPSGLGHEKYLHIRQDLRQLGQQDEPALCDTLPDVTSMAAQLGVCYVMEGANLGGRVILKRLKHLFGDEVLPATRFYQGYGRNTGAYWGLFRAYMKRFVTVEPHSQQQIINAANDTFSTLHHWLNK